MTLRQRLFIWYGAVLLVACGLFVTEAYLLVAHKMKKEFYQFLTDEYEEAVRATNEAIDDLHALEQSFKAEVKGRRFFAVVYRLFDVQKGQEVLLAATRWEKQLQALPPPRVEKDGPHQSILVVGEDPRSRPVADNGPGKESTGPQRGHSTFRVSEEGGDEIHFLTGWPNRQAHPNLLLQVGLSYRRVYRRLHSLLYYFLVAFAVTIALATLGGNLLASRALKPIRQMATSLEKTSAGNLSNRLPEPKTRDEVGRIVCSFNAMLARLDEAFQYLRDFTADAAHELRSPLAAAKCRLQVALERERETPEYQEAIRDTLDQLSGLGKLVDSLLLLANLDSRPDSPEGRQDVDLSALLSDIVDFFGIVAEQKGVNLNLDCPRQCTVNGNPTLLRRLFSNLVENAIRHTRPGGNVRVEASPAGPGWEVAVADTGPGVDAGDLDRIFQRFYTGETRGDREGGVGLGLSICKKIVDVHNGRISVISEQGKQTSFIVHLPS